jgi:hypothetical protein
MKHNQKTHLDKHFSNLNRLSKGEKLKEKDYEYLYWCFWCGKRIRNIEFIIPFWIIHGFDGNCHRWCRKQEQSEEPESHSEIQLREMMEKKFPELKEGKTK